MPEPELNREDYLNTLDKTETRQQKTQDLIEHLSELRDRILIAIGVFALFTLLSFYFSETLIYALERPAPIGTKFFQLKPGEIFLSSLKISSFFGIVFSLPIWLMQIKAFVEPGLKETEKKIITPIVILAPLLFYLGIGFAYFWILPSLLNFLLSYGATVVESSYSLDYYLSLVISILCICGICFQIPIILISLSQMKLISSKQLIQPWRYVIIFCFAISAIITPTPDPLTMSILALVLMALYFVTVFAISLLKDP